jgi:hypothetical protein
MSGREAARWAAALFLASFALVLYELVLVRLFAVVLFAAFAHLALGLALLGISAGGLAALWWPPDPLAAPRRLGLLAVAQGNLGVGAVVLLLRIPLTTAASEVVESFQVRASVASELVDPWWMLVAIGALALPFAAGGALVAEALALSGRRAGMLYGADLAGGALACLLLVPLLDAVAAPQLSLVCLAALGGSAWLFGARREGGATVALAVVGFALGDAAGMFAIRHPAGIPEAHVVDSRWTALARIAIHEGPDRTLVLLDNSSASEVVRTHETRERLWREATARSLVYRLAPKGRVAVLGASAGPEVAMAQRGGFTDIDAIDIVGPIGDTLATRYAADPINPYAQPGVRRVQADGRAAIARAETPYAVIHLVHANLHSAAGLLAAAWSPGLLTTTEAFAVHLGHLEPDGIASFAGGVLTPTWLPSAAAALHERGCPPRDCLAYVGGNQPVVLLRPRPWTPAEIAALQRAAAAYPYAPVLALPGTDPPPELFRGRPQTDDHPFPSTTGFALGAVGDSARVFGTLSRLLALQAAGLVGFAAAALLPSLWVLRRRGAPRLLPALLFAGGLGYGYLALETVLVHRFVLVVGHPTAAIAAVVGALMASSGVASLLTTALPDRHVRPALWAGLGAVLLLGVLLPPIVALAVDALADPSSTQQRAAVVAAALLPLGAAMGTPMALGLRCLGDARLVPWVWAINGWTSVLATVASVQLSREWGFAVAAAVALGAYGLAAFAVLGLADVEPRAASG